MARSTTGLGRSPRTRLDQNSVELEDSDDTVILGKQPGEVDAADDEAAVASKRRKTAS